MFKNGGKPEEIVKAKNLAQVSDEGFIQETIAKILNDNPKEVQQYLAGKDTICNGSWDKSPALQKARLIRM